MINVPRCEHQKPNASSFRAKESVEIEQRNTVAEGNVALRLNPEPYYCFGSENGGEDSALAVRMQEQTLLSGHGC